MIRSSALRCAAGFLLAAILLLPPGAAAGESPRGQTGKAPAGLASFLVRAWDSLIQALPEGWRPVTTASGDNGWQIDPDG